MLIQVSDFLGGFLVGTLFALLAYTFVLLIIEKHMLRLPFSDIKIPKNGRSKFKKDEKSNGV